MGPACHPLCTIKLSILELFLAPHIFFTCLFLSIPCRLSNGDTAAAKWDPMSSSMYYKTFFSLIIFGTSYLVTCLFLSIPCRLSNGDTAAAKWDPHVILYVQSSFFS